MNILHSPVKRIQGIPIQENLLRVLGALGVNGGGLKGVDGGVEEP